MSLQNIIETAFENRADITPTTVTPEVKEAVLETIRQLDSGKLRVAERLGVGEWKVNEWAKKAVLLSFRIQDNEVLNDGVNKYFDKVPTKFADWSEFLNIFVHCCFIRYDNMRLLLQPFFFVCSC